MDISKRIRQLREKNSMSQEDIAQLTRLHRVTISRLENGHNMPHPLTRAILENLADILENGAKWIT